MKINDARLKKLLNLFFPPDPDHQKSFGESIRTFKGNTDGKHIETLAKQKASKLTGIPEQELVRMPHEKVLELVRNSPSAKANLELSPAEIAEIESKGGKKTSIPDIEDQFPSLSKTPDEALVAFAKREKEKQKQGETEKVLQKDALFLKLVSETERSRNKPESEPRPTAKDPVLARASEESASKKSVHAFRRRFDFTIPRLNFREAFRNTKKGDLHSFFNS